MKKMLFLLLLVVGMASCINDDLEKVDTVIPNQNQLTSFKISPEEATKMVTILAKPLMLTWVPQSMILLTLRQVLLQTTNTTLNIRS